MAPSIWLPLKWKPSLLGATRIRKNLRFAIPSTSPCHFSLSLPSAVTPFPGGSGAPTWDSTVWGGEGIALDAFPDASLLVVCCFPPLQAVSTNTINAALMRLDNTTFDTRVIRLRGSIYQLPASMFY